MKAPLVAKVRDQQSQVHHEEDKRGWISEPGHGPESGRRGQLAKRHDEEKTCRQTVKEHVPGHESVPWGRLVGVVVNVAIVGCGRGAHQGLPSNKNVSTMASAASP